MTTSESGIRALSKHRAVQAVRSLIRRYPHAVLYQEIIDVLGEDFDEQRLCECFKTWVKRGYYAGNLAWLFDWYATGRIPPIVGGTRGPIKSSVYVGRQAPATPVQKLSDNDTVRLFEQICPPHIGFESYLDGMVQRQQITADERLRYLSIRQSQRGGVDG